MLSAKTEPRKTLKIVGQVVEKGAFDRAKERAYSEGLTIHRSLSDESLFYVSSVSYPGIWHLVSDIGCDCEAARRGLVCKHVVAVRLAQQKLGLLIYCPKCRTVRRLSRRIAERLGPDNKVRRAVCAHCGDLPTAQISNSRAA